MDLNEFVRRTLEDVTQGVFEAQSACKGRARVGATRTTVAAKNLRVLRDAADTADTALRPMGSSDERLAGTHSQVDFDVAVGVVESTEKGGKAAITVFGFGVGGGTAKEAQTSTTHRIKFSVPVVFLPAQGNI